jgi:hypothetical protein
MAIHKHHSRILTAATPAGRSKRFEKGSAAAGPRPPTGAAAPARTQPLPRASTAASFRCSTPQPRTPPVSTSCFGGGRNRSRGLGGGYCALASNRPAPLFPAPSCAPTLIYIPGGVQPRHRLDSAAALPRRPTRHHMPAHPGSLLVHRQLRGRRGAGASGAGTAAAERATRRRCRHRCSQHCPHCPSCNPIRCSWLNGV